MDPAEYADDQYAQWLYDEGLREWANDELNVINTKENDDES